MHMCMLRLEENIKVHFRRKIMFKKIFGFVSVFQKQQW